MLHLICLLLLGNGNISRSHVSHSLTLGSFLSMWVRFYYEQLQSKDRRTERCRDVDREAVGRTDPVSTASLPLPMVTCHQEMLSLFAGTLKPGIK